jgi:hypothetical protein
LATAIGQADPTTRPGAGDSNYYFYILSPKLTHVVSEIEFGPRGLSDDTMQATKSSATKVHSSLIKKAAHRVTISSSIAASIIAVDKDDYMSRRTMTPLQERMNGFTMLAGALYGSYYCFSGMWLWDNVDQVDPSAFAAAASDALHCRTSSSWLLRDLHATPPLPMIFITLGLVAHAPVSFIYHWHYCTTLPPGKPRFDHWSRKLDQAFIHVASAFMSYGTSGRWDYFALNVIFNAYCAWCTLISTTATPVKTQLRILVSVILYTFPFLQRNDNDTFLLAWAVIGSSLWLFATYPIRGWSHSAFHLTIALLVPILMEAAGELSASQQQITRAAKCAVLSGRL